MEGKLYLSYLDDIINQSGHDENKPMSPYYKKSYLGSIIDWYVCNFTNGGWDAEKGVVRHPPEILADSYILAQIYQPPIQNIDYISNMIEKIDNLLPDVEILEDCTHGLVINKYAPAFKLPNKMMPISAAECALACRALIKLQDSLVFNTELSIEQILCALDNSSKICLMLGGEECFLHLYNIVKLEETYRIHENIHDNTFIVEFSEGENINE